MIIAEDDAPSGRHTTAARAMALVVSATALIVGGAYLAIHSLHAPAADAVEHPGPAATEAQTRSEVIDHARNIVAATGLRQPSAGYLLMSCKNRDDPPYQGAIYMNFRLPTDVSADQYFAGMAAAMVARGWREGLPPNQHMFGRNLSKDGVNALLYPDSDSSTRGVARIYGQCHAVTDHRGARSGWIDVTDRLH